MRIQVSVLLIIFFLGILMLTFVVEAQAADQAGVCKSFTDCAAPVSALLHYLALSIILEMALTVVFNWRLFLKYAESKGLKTPIAILFAAIIVFQYKLDIMNDVLNALGMCDQAHDCNASKPTPVGYIVTAFVLAGGSAGVLQIFTKLGIRNPFERKEKAAEVAAA